MFPVKKMSLDEINALAHVKGEPARHNPEPEVKASAKTEETRERSRFDSVVGQWVTAINPKTTDKYVVVVGTVRTKIEFRDALKAQDEAVGAARALAKLGAENIAMYYCGDKGITQEEIKSKAKAEERTRLEHNMRLAGMSEDMIKAVLG